MTTGIAGGVFRIVTPCEVPLTGDRVNGYTDGVTIVYFKPEKGMSLERDDVVQLEGREGNWNVEHCFHTEAGVMLMVTKS